MLTSASDVINLAASVVTILGGLASLVGFVRKMAQPVAAVPSSAPAPTRGFPPANAPTAGYPQQGYPPQQKSPQGGYFPPSQDYPGYPQRAHPPQPGYPPAAGRPPIYAPTAIALRARRIPHPVIFGFAALALASVVIYSLTLLYQFHQTGSTNITTHDPLIAVTATTITLNLLAGTVAVIGMIITTARARAWGWLTFAIVGLCVMLLTIGIFSVVALVPACFYALYDARPSLAVGASR